MKKTVFVLAMVCAFSITATHVSAQDNTPKEKNKSEVRGDRRGPGGNSMDMYKDLNLTKDQESKIKAIDEEQRTKMQELRKDNTLSEDARREKMMAMRKERMEKVNAVLTKEQQSKWEAQRKERMNRGGERPNRGNGSNNN